MNKTEIVQLIELERMSNRKEHNLGIRTYEALGIANKAVILLPELTEALEFTLTQCEHTTKEMDDKIIELIQKAKELIE
jgi:hypothetical protein